MNNFLNLDILSLKTSISLLLALAGFCVPPAKADWQLLDSTGKVVVTFPGKNVKYAGAGLYMYWLDTDPIPRITDKNGKPVTIPMPKGWHFQNLLLPNPDTKLSYHELLPADALIIAHKAGWAGVLAPDGQVTVPPEFERIDIIDSHRLRLSKDNPEEFREEVTVYDGFANTQESVIPAAQFGYQKIFTPNSDSLDSLPSVTLLNARGETLKSGLNDCRICEPDRVLVQTLKRTFDADEWKNPGLIYRGTLFGQFLRDHDLIGMPRKEVYKWLGAGQENGDRASYYLRTGGCGFGGSPAIVIRYDKHDCVDGWKCSANASVPDDSAWNTQNVVLKKRIIQSDSDFKLTVPKTSQKALNDRA